MAEVGASNTSARRAMEERETTKSRLLDQRFSIKNYPDPLRPRPKDLSKALPAGVTPDMEKTWLRVIQDARK